MMPRQCPTSRCLSHWFTRAWTPLHPVQQEDVSGIWGKRITCRAPVSCFWSALVTSSGEHEPQWAPHHRSWTIWGFTANSSCCYRPNIPTHVPTARPTLSVQLLPPLPVLQPSGTLKTIPHLHLESWDAKMVEVFFSLSRANHYVLLIFKNIFKIFPIMTKEHHAQHFTAHLSWGFCVLLLIIPLYSKTENRMKLKSGSELIYGSSLFPAQIKKTTACSFNLLQMGPALPSPSSWSPAEDLQQSRKVGTQNRQSSSTPFIKKKNKIHKTIYRSQLFVP